MLNLSALKDISRFKKYKSGEVVVSETDAKWDEMFILLKGEVSVVKDKGKPTQTILNTLKAGSFFGEMSLFCSMPRTATIVANEECIMVALEKNSFLEFSEKNSYVVFQLIATICDRLASTGKENAALRKRLTEFVSAQEVQQIATAAVAGEKPHTFGSDLGEVTVKGNSDPSAPKAPNPAGEISISAVGFLPEGHKQYGLPHEAIHDGFLLPRSYSCPNCKQKFEGVTVLTSKLRPKAPMKCDLKREYNDLPATWYDLVTCPYCLFTTFESSWDKTPYIKPDTATALMELNGKVDVNFLAPRNIDIAFVSYYLALICAAAYDNRYQLETRLWRQLSWMYGDVEDKELERYATEKAFASAKEYYSKGDLSGDGVEQSLLMILGTLARRLGDLDEATNYIGAAKFMRDGKVAYKMLIEDEIDALNEEKEKKREAAKAEAK